MLSVTCICQAQLQAHGMTVNCCEPPLSRFVNLLHLSPSHRLRQNVHVHVICCTPGCPQRLQVQSPRASPFNQCLTPYMAVMLSNNLTVLQMCCCHTGGSSQASSTAVATSVSQVVTTALAKALATVTGTASSG